MNPIRKSLKFLNYWLASLDAHGLHSPFSYRLYQEVIHPAPERLPFSEDFRKRLENSVETIRVTDLGAGSKVDSSELRSVGRLAREGVSPAKFSALLYRLIRHMNYRNILELGTSLGINTVYLARAAPDGQVITMEGCPETAGVARELFISEGIEHIQQAIGPIEYELEGLLEGVKSVDMVYCDANHRLAPTLKYFHKVRKYIAVNGVFILDDIYWSEEMETAWKEICQHPSTSLTIDLFDAGLAFFDSSLQKETIKIEYASPF